MIQLIYTSRAEPLFSDLQIGDILTVSRRNNARGGITGLLLYKAGQVIQVLEGEERRVLNLFESIRRDDRHREVAVVYRNPIAEREFGDWSMGFRPLDTGFLALPRGAEDIRRLITALALRPDSSARSKLIEFNQFIA